ncbi:M3 family metallopeptidase [Segetibacter aerophilus]|uniref:Dipeptidyl carboxypeptidase n=1 Tax=Segetibacter aerophilus TaxID=670293 RepID=A0A512BJA3_9BACT|nr:M3 family metallopeptidase [Segetibacter aerophilus]GEO12042.1 dipeptidyl carboxypeptidase II [Segetibacter aerophilus]
MNTSFSQTENKLPEDNPLKFKSTLPYQAIPFDKIKDEHYGPALLEGLRLQLEEVNKIANNPAPPTFENTLVALELAGDLLNRASSAFGSQTSANTNPVLQKLREEMAPKMAANSNEIFLNSKLFQRIQAVYNKRAALKLDAESKALLELTYHRFRLAGANLSPAAKEQMKKLNEEEATLSAKFGNMLVSATKNGAVVISDSSELAGLPPGELAGYAQAAKNRSMEGKWVLPLQNTTQQPALQSLQVRSTRQKIFEASWNRTERGDSTDTRIIVTRLAAIRAQKAKLMSFPNFAAWRLQEQMAKTPEAVDQFFAELAPAAAAKAKEEAGEIQALIDQQKGGFTLEPWDWNFYSEQVRMARYAVDDKEVKPYFEVNTVLEKGVFHAANLLYGISFKERNDLPVYHPDVRVFEVFDKDGKSFALFYCDYFKRDNKQGGAWCSALVGKSTLKGTQPVVVNVCNLPKPAPGEPALVNFDHVRTMFHEFGHALHALFAQQKYSGGRVPRDFVEFPSQFNEHWAMDANVLKNYAVHYKTAALIPTQLLEKIKQAANFNAGYGLTEAIEASLLDLRWHKLSPTDVVKDVDAFEKEALQSTGIDIKAVPPRYRSSYFQHIWSGGYAAGYYAYQWTKMLSKDAYEWFEEHGGLTRANGQRFRDMILSKGMTVDYKSLYKAFRGKDASINAMLKNMALKKKA